MERLMDLGLERLRSMTMDMAEMSQHSISKALDGYRTGEDVSGAVKEISDRIEILRDEVSELAVEVIARYQPVAKDLRFIRTCMEISYDFTRFGRYAYEISLINSMVDVEQCGNETVNQVAEVIRQMIRDAIDSFSQEDQDKAESLHHLDERVDEEYLSRIREMIENGEHDIDCALAEALLLRHLERIGDHACYIASSVLYMVTGQKESIR